MLSIRKVNTRGVRTTADQHLFQGWSVDDLFLPIHSRALLDVPFHSVTAWDADSARIISGAEHALEHKCSTPEMTRVFCRHCGETVYNTNAMGRRLVPVPRLVGGPVGHRGRSRHRDRSCRL